ncbi:MAG TPA: MarR family transcriptional regulator [Cyclobacteriaceae bacterium]|jgi:DNA-binding MarR family transcriptional regulator|nr:MarR family transcriptional regulator [Cytophagales bacterium]HNT51664.1 MarR family transcriptional regulator [Cyclobacteriaceae bacterium]HRE65314.1 MarR family transcriptional regulator [Cyclobacteriaceae bacterium]HRF35118.1 MarR family transcriptional regulator [Cyclobacteriaceae bacterium]
MKREETVDYHIRSAWHAIARMYNQQALKYGGTMSIGFALLNIDSDKGTPATKIAPLMGLETRSLTRLLKSMEDKGLISRESDTLDKRSVRIKLTAEGKIHREHSKEIVLRFNEAVKEEISAGKLNTFFEVVQGINQLIENNKIYDKILQ